MKLPTNDFEVMRYLQQTARALVSKNKRLSDADYKQTERKAQWTYECTDLAYASELLTDFAADQHIHLVYFNLWEAVNGKINAQFVAEFVK